MRLLHLDEIPSCIGHAGNIIGLGTVSFMMQLTSSLVNICCNSVLSATGGDVYISVMTIVSSVRQIVETPIGAMNDGTSPIISYNYGARRPKRVKKAIFVLACLVLVYFMAFIFMDLQYIGQTVFKSLNKKKHAIFFSLLRKVFIVVPLTYFMPYVLHMGTDGVFMAEPVSNLIGGSLCFITMLITVMPELKRMENSK